MSHDTSVTWLKTASWVLIAVGVYFAWALYAPLNTVSLVFLDLAVFPIDGAQSQAATETRLLTAIVGGLTAGIGAVTLAITRHVYAGDPDLGARLLLSLYIPWFIIDSAGSVLAGAWFNVILNCSILGLVLPPLLMRRAPVAA